MSTQHIAIERAVALLTAAKVDFKVITEDGVEYGNLVAAKRKVGKKVFTRPRGEMLNHFKPFVENMKPGDVARVPSNFYTVEEVRGPLASWCSSHWGNGSYITTVDRKTHEIEVLRVL